LIELESNKFSKKLLLSPLSVMIISQSSASLTLTATSCPDYSESDWGCSTGQSERSRTL